MKTMSISLIAAGFLVSLPYGMAQAQDCNRLVDYFPTAVSLKDKTCRYGPQPPRYHSCLDQKANVEMMAKNILQCRGLSSAQRTYYAKMARTYNGAADAAVQRDMQARAARRYYVPPCFAGIPVNGMCIIP